MITQGSLIVVGVDGWPAADRALVWALELAQQVGATVEVVTAWSGERTPVPTATRDVDDREYAANVQRTAVERVLSGRPSALVVSMQMVEGSPGEVLVEASRRADLLVLGSHGHRKAYELAVGSTSDYALREARCPVVVIPVPLHDPRGQHEAVAPAGST